MFKKIVRFFGPEWGAAVMGTAALSITLQLASEVARPFLALPYFGLGFYLLTTRRKPSKTPIENKIGCILQTSMAFTVPIHQKVL
jgi:hypothetical protein